MGDHLSLATLIRRARGQEPADLLLANGQVINVFTGEVLPADIAIAGGIIVGLGRGYSARETIDLAGRVVCPGFIDGHLHIESTMLTPYQFARAAVPRGTTAVVCDPHEIANVLGLDGIRYMLGASENLPLTVFAMASSCVPATHLETAGASLSAQDLSTLLDHPRVLGLAEMMNYPGVLLGLPDVLAKLEMARRRGLPIDGHAPGLSGRDLQAYVAAGVRSDHECTDPDEAREKLRAGMYLMIREGTTEHNLAELLPVVTPENARRCLLVSDDRHPDDLMDRGHLDYSIRLAAQQGLNPITAVQMVTLNAAERFRLWDRGAVAPGYRADLVVLDNLEQLTVEQVFSGGVRVARNGQMLPAPPPEAIAAPPSVRVNWDRLNLEIPARGEQARIIGIVEGQIVTESLTLAVKKENGLAVADPERDLLKLAVIERHAASGNVGLGFVRGLGLKRGALASTVAHDSHNLIVAGANDADMLAAAQAVARMGGGLVAVVDGQTIARLALPVAGLMSQEPLETVRAGMDALLAAARDLGSRLHNPFMILSFLALPVIPALKLTDRGLVDVNQFDFVPLFV
ncbi:MAG: adenine deaminase [Chloroflexota bacterium]